MNITASEMSFSLTLCFREVLVVLHGCKAEMLRLIAQYSEV